MKKTLCVIAIVLCGILTTPGSAQAYGGEIAGTIGTIGTATVIGAESAYEASVIKRIGNRAGASTASGAKGICLEVIYSDMKNFVQNPTNRLKTSLSLSSVDPVADLITTNKTGEVVRLIQCKDGISVTQINKVIEQVSSGKYATVELVGTTEFASLYNKKATAQGISQFATDSGISTNTTTKIAHKALGIAPSETQVFKAVSRNSGIGAAAASCLSLAESIYRGDSFYATAGNLIEDTSISAVSVTLATIASSEMPAFLASLGAGAVTANVATAVVAIAIPVASGYVLYLLADECQLEENIADIMEDIAVSVTTTYHNVEEAVISYDIPSKAAIVWETMANASSNLKRTTCELVPVVLNS